MKTIDHDKIIESLAVKIKEQCLAPEWAINVKTGHGKQRPPIRDDWWQIRAASVLLSVEKLGPVGVSKLSIKYGNRKNRGNKPEKFAKASRSILRKILQQLEKAKFVEQTVIKHHKGRILTNEGNRLIISASKPTKIVKEAN